MQCLAGQALRENVSVSFFFLRQSELCGLLCCLAQVYTIMDPKLHQVVVDECQAKELECALDRWFNGLVQKQLEKRVIYGIH